VWKMLCCSEESFLLDCPVCACWASIYGQRTLTMLFLTVQFRVSNRDCCPSFTGISRTRWTRCVYNDCVQGLLLVATTCSHIASSASSNSVEDDVELIRIQYTVSVVTVVMFEW
jgi:hypothetical protein